MCSGRLSSFCSTRNVENNWRMFYIYPLFNPMDIHKNNTIHQNSIVTRYDNRGTITVLIGDISLFISPEAVILFGIVSS